LAAISVAHELGVSIEAIKAALKKFQGIGRRMHRYGEIGLPDCRFTLVDDYAHHPTELSATISAARNAWPDKRLVVVFQPHRYTRTRDLFEDFTRVLAECDVLVLTEVYAAGEEVINGADGRALCAAVRARGKVNPVFIEDVEQLSIDLANIVKPGDLVLTAGAGSIGRIASELKNKMEAGE
jgi:UDP-N-acetylmuramate--alanine ligase